jgi:hypothetical protein
MFSPGRLLNEWLAWRELVEADLLEQKRELGLPEEQDTADAEGAGNRRGYGGDLQEKGGGSE